MQTKTLTKQQFDELYALFAIFANVEALDESGEPHTLSLAEIQKFGTAGLNLMDELQAPQPNHSPDFDATLCTDEELMRAVEEHSRRGQ